MRVRFRPIADVRTAWETETWRWGRMAMATTPREPRRQTLWATRNGVLLAAAIVSSVIAWWMIAWPVASLSNTGSHKGHFALTFAHMLGGSGMLFFGALNLYLAAR